MGRRKSDDSDIGCAIALVVTFIILAKIGRLFTGSTDDIHNAIVGGSIALGLVLLTVLFYISRDLRDHLKQRREQRKWTELKHTADAVKQLHVTEHRVIDPISQSDRRLAQMYLELAGSAKKLEHKRDWLERALEHLPDNEEIQSRLEETQQELRQEREEQERRIRALALADVDHMKGIDFEHYVGRLLTHQGFQVEFTTGSGDFGVDLIAERSGERWAVQCKRRKAPVSLRAVQEVVAGKLHYGCSGAMVITNSTFRSSAMELAESSECKLIDRDTLADWIHDFQIPKQSSEYDESPEDGDESQLAMF